MGSTCKESYEDFLDLLKQVGIEITNEAELRARLAESNRWRFAFRTLAANGRQIGISFGERGEGIDAAEIRRAFDEFAFPEDDQTVFSDALKTTH